MKYFSRFVLIVLVLSASACFGAYNAAKPADNEYVADVPALVRENFRAIKDDAIVNAGTVSGYSVGNASGNIPRSNGTLNTNLNSDLLDGYHASAFNASDALLLRLDGSRAMTGNLKFSGNYGILQSTSDGADNSYVVLSGGGAGRYSSGGGWAQFTGNEFAINGGMLALGCGQSSRIAFYGDSDAEMARMTSAGRWLLKTTTDDGVNALQVNGSIKGAGFTMAADGYTVYWGANAYLQGNNTAGTLNLVATTINTTGTLKNFGDTVWTAGNDGAGSGLDADNVHGVNLAPQEKTAQTMDAAGWFRIAQSASGISRNHGIIEIDWAMSGYHGACHLAAGNHYGAAGGTGLNLLGLSFYPTGVPTGITKARIVYHATYSGNYAYLEVYADRNLSNTIAYRITQGLGWTLINATAGSIPSGYTSQEIAFADCNLNHGKAIFPEAGTYDWTCPPGVWSVTVEIVGGGGAGGNCGDGTGPMASGGGGSGYAYRQKQTVTPGTVYTVICGTYGAISGANGGSGGSGGTSYFRQSSTDLITAIGGSGGTGVNATNAEGSGGTGQTYGGDGIIGAAPHAGRGAASAIAIRNTSYGWLSGKGGDGAAKSGGGMGYAGLNGGTGACVIEW